jgi:hypothetical protein
MGEKKIPLIALAPKKNHPKQTSVPKDPKYLKF